MKYVKSSAFLVFLLINFSFAYAIKPLFYGGMEFETSMADASIPASIFEDAGGEFGSFTALGLRLNAGAEMAIFHSKSNFVRELNIYSDIGVRYSGAAPSSDLYVGRHFLNNSLDDVVLDNQISFSMYSFLLNAGIVVSTPVKGLRLTSGIGLTFPINTEFEMASQLKDPDIRFADNTPSDIRDYSDDFSGPGLNLSIGVLFTFYSAEDISLAARINSNIELKGMMAIPGQSDYSFNQNYFAIGIQMYIHPAAEKNVHKKNEKPVRIAPSKKTLTISHKIYNKNQSDQILAAEINNFDKYYVLHPFIYYQQEDDIIPDQNYTMIKKSERKRYAESRKNNLHPNISFEKFSSDLLNQIGYSLYSDASKKLTIRYPKHSPNPETDKRRVEYLIAYYIEIWGISQARIKSKPAVQTANLLCLDIDQSIISFDSQIAYTVLSDKIEFQIDPGSEKIEKWDIAIQHYLNNGLVNVFDTSGQGSIRKFIYNISAKDDLILSSYEKIQYTFRAECEDGSIQEKLVQIPLDLSTARGSAILIEGKLSDIINEASEIRSLIDKSRVITIYAPIASMADEVARLFGIRTFDYQMLNPGGGDLYSDQIRIKIL